MRFIGDIHGTYNLREYEMFTKTCDTSIQIGDLGIGFSPGDDKRMFKNIDRSKHFFIRGNHDNPEVCEAQVNHIQSGMWLSKGMFFVNGGWSIDGPGCPWDRGYRSEGRGWWSKEQHHQDELDELIEEYRFNKPDIVITHEGPTQATDLFFNPVERWVSRTALTLEKMFDIHKPDIWIFGHWHKRRDSIIDGTRFICLQECGYVDI